MDRQRRPQKRRAAVIVLALMAAMAAPERGMGDTVRLKNGRTVTGTIVRQTKTAVVVEPQPGIQAAYSVNDIEAIEKESALPASSPATRTGEEGAASYRALFAMAHLPSPAVEKEALGVIAGGWSGEHAELAAWLDDHRDLLSRSAEIEAIGACDFYKGVEKRSFATPPAYPLWQPRTLAQLLLVDGRRSESRGEIRGAIERYGEALKLARDLPAQDTTFLAMVVSLGIRNMAYAPLAALSKRLDKRDPDRALLTALLNRLGHQDVAVVDAIRFEKELFLTTIGDLYTGPNGIAARYKGPAKREAIVALGASTVEEARRLLDYYLGLYETAARTHSKEDLAAADRVAATLRKEAGLGTMDFTKVVELTTSMIFRSKDERKALLAATVAKQLVAVGIPRIGPLITMYDTAETGYSALVKAQ